MTKIREMTVEHLGPDATEDDLEKFESCVFQVMTEEPTLTEEEAVELVWNDGDYLGFALDRWGQE